MSMVKDQLDGSGIENDEAAKLVVCHSTGADREPPGRPNAHGGGGVSKTQ